MENQFRRSIKPVNPLNAIMWIVMVIFAISFFFFIAKGIFSLLSYVAPLLFIASFILDRSVILNYGKFLINKIKTNPIIGIGATALSLLAFPLLGGYFFLRSLLNRNIKKKIGVYKEREEAYTNYKEVEDDFLSLPELENPVSDNKKDKSTDDYEQLFD